MLKISLIYLIIMLLLFSYGCNSIEEVKIGDQVWMKKNLDVDLFQNGDPILQVNSSEEWREAEAKRIPAWSYYDYNPKNAEKYGKLYNWYAVIDNRGLAPEGWKIPSDSDYEILKKSGNIDCRSLKAIGEGEDDYAGTNTTGFSAYLGGYKNKRNSRFSGMGEITFLWWAVKENSDTYTGGCVRFGNLSRMLIFEDYKDIDGASVRCIKNN